MLLRIDAVEMASVINSVDAGKRLVCAHLGGGGGGRDLGAWGGSDGGGGGAVASLQKAIRNQPKQH